MLPLNKHNMSDTFVFICSYMRAVECQLQLMFLLTLLHVSNDTLPACNMRGVECPLMFLTTLHNVNDNSSLPFNENYKRAALTYSRNFFIDICM